MKVHTGRLVAFLLLLATVLAAMFWATPDLSRSITLGLDLQGGFEVLYQLQPVDESQKITSAVVSQTAAALERRISVLGVAEPSITPEGSDRIRVQLAGVQDQDAARQMLGTPARLTFRDMETGEVLLSGADLKEGGASVGFDQLNRPLVQVQFKNAQKFADISGAYVGKQIGIFLDEDLLSAPVVRERIPGGTATIDGQRSVEEAQMLVDLLNAGSLPVNLKELSAQSVGATLGQRALQDSVVAGIIGGVVMLLFMLLYYRLPGAIAGVTLLIYTFVLLAVFSVLGVTLTLSGIAAFVLGLGMAVDANILTAERIKEEIRLGKSIPSALKVGSRRAFMTILDANLTTFLAAVVIFFIGTGTVRGFATTLMISIVLSMVTNVWLSRLLLNGVVNWSGFGRKPWYYGVREDQISEL